MNLHQIQYVLAVAECGNFSKAARKLYVSQPTLSQQIALLEDELGVTLFIRYPRKVELTNAGNIFYSTRTIS